MDIIAKLKNQGWYLSDDGIKKLPEDVDKTDTRKIIQAAMDMDLREIGGGALATDLFRKGDTIPGRIVLQIIKIRNIAAPKADEEHRGAPRMFQLELTDGINQIQAIEIEHISGLSFNTPPGSKVYLKGEKVSLTQGMIMLKSNDIQVLGGKVSHLYEKWEMSRTLLKYAKGGRVMNGGTSGPPPWTPFGQRILQQNIGVGADKNFKSLSVANEKEGKENNEFDAMRNEAIAEAAKTGSKKVFGGGNQQIVDHNVKKILEKGYSEEEAKNALRGTRNNLERALYNLKRRDEYKHREELKNSGYDRSKSSGISNDRSSLNSGKRSANTSSRDNFTNKKGGKDDSVSTKPAGNVSLFDFLTDKLPTNVNETEKASSSTLPNSQHYGTSSNQQSSRYDSRTERSSRGGDSYSSSNSKGAYYSHSNSNSGSNTHQQASSYSDNRNQNLQSNQHHIPNSHSNSRSSVNQKFENNLSSSFQANRNYTQDDRPRNRNNRESAERSGTASSNIGSNRNYQSSYQGRSGGGGNANDRQYEEQSSDRYYNNRDHRVNNYAQRNLKAHQSNERDGNSRSGQNERSNYQGTNTSHFQYHQNNNTGNYENSRNYRNDNQAYRNGYESARSGNAGGNYNQSVKGNHTLVSSTRYSQKDNNPTNSYQQNQSQSQGANNSRNYSDNRQQSYHQHPNQSSDSKMNKLIEDTSKLKIDQQSQLQQQQQQHNTKSRQSQNITAHRSQNSSYQHQQQQQHPQQQPPQQQQQHHQKPHITTQHQQQVMAVIPHKVTPSIQSQITQHTMQPNQQQTHAHYQQSSQVHSLQHSIQSSTFAQLTNGYAYDPNKIMGFQNKESNEFALTLLKSQGIPTTLTPTTALVPPQQHPHPSVTPTAVSQSSTPHPGAGPYQTMQIGHPPPPTISQHSFATAGPAFVMQSASIAPPPQITSLGPQVAHTHTPVQAGLAGPPQQNPGAPYGMNPGESWNWKNGDRCLAKYWDDGRYYEAEITGVSENTCVVFYLGYGNHEEVLKSDCLPITDAQNRAINFGTTPGATVVAIQQQQQQPPPTAVQLAGASRGGLPNRYRGDRQMYVPPPKRDG